MKNMKNTLILSFIFTLMFIFAFICVELSIFAFKQMRAERVIVSPLPESF